MNPGLILFQDAIALLEKENIGYGLRTSILFECGIGEPDRTNKVAAGGDIATHLFALFVQCSAGGNKGNEAAVSYLINGFGQKIIMDAEMEFVIRAVADREISEGDVADCTIEKAVGQIRFFKTCNLNFCFLIQLFGNPTGQIVQFYAIQFCTVQIEAVGFVCKKSTGSHAGFQNIAARNTHALQCTIHAVDNLRRGIEGGQSAAAGRLIFWLSEQALQFCVFLCPVGFLRVKGICQTTPTTIFCQYRLFLAVGRIAALCYPLFNSFQGSNRGYVCGVLFFR